MSVHHILEICAAVRNGYLFFFREFAVGCRIVTPSLIFACIMISFGAWLLFGDAKYTPPKIFPEMVAGIIVLFTTGHIAVGVHRAILLSEKRPKILRFGWPEARCIAILTGLAAGLYVPRVLDIQSTTISLLLTLAAVAVIIWVLAVLPAVAISDSGMTLGIAWRNLRKNRIRFVVIILATWTLLLAHLIVGAEVAVVLVKFWISITPLFHFPAIIEMIFFTVPLLSVVIFGYIFILVVFLGVLSESYKFIAMCTMSSDLKYRPPMDLLEQLPKERPHDPGVDKVKARTG